MIKIAILSSMVLAGSAFASDRQEICVEDACALMVQAEGHAGNLYVVKSEAEYLALSAEWPGARFVQADEDEYSIVKTRLGIGTVVMAKRKNPAPQTGRGGPLVTGSITVGDITFGGGGGKGCADCHTGSWRRIHAEVLKKPSNEN